MTIILIAISGRDSVCHLFHILYHKNSNPKPIFVNGFFMMVFMSPRWNDF